ncbi:hypothetical protein A0H81_04826 [Grifola frondosa]|uniref:RING-type domain-containing protein n=1 Tax=Grifola frondosa TaxID=5627 RepID=A0A1C7MFN7_GRIFR|nr:hypothetical protein A0H81_04826 [Grifola frondosa]
MSTRVHPHSPLPAPALHAIHVSSQSKSHVLAGVQDAYWSDDEAEDAECPLCLEEMDISDLNFKPCPCGYQVCRFCWHHIKENLNGRCPACRREYTDEAVQFKPVNKEDHKRLTQQKKQRERERKELDGLGRRHLANVRVVQRNVVYVVGLGPRFAKEELIPTLRSNEYFGQYGKISKIVIVKRTSPGGRAPVVGLYITYHRREDAARAIAAVDGAPSPGGGHDVMRASYGTTKYCMAFLRGVSCTDHSCMNLHEWGDEKDCFTKEDLTTLKHTMKDTESRTRTTVVKKSDDSDAGLPRAASWANKGSVSVALHNNTNAVSQALANSRQTRRVGTGTTRQQRSGSTTTTSTPATMEVRTAARDRKTAAKASSQASSSRPATPASTSLPHRPVTPATARASKVKEPVPPPRSPTSSIAVDSDVGSQEVTTTSPASRPLSADVPAVPPGIPVVPPGLSAPPGLPPPSRVTPDIGSVGSSPLVSAVNVSQPSYQMSTQAQALMEDIRARRESILLPVTQSPFPDFDRMLQTLSGNGGEFGGFSFNLDPKLVGEGQDVSLDLPDLVVESNVAYTGSFFDVFPALRPGGQSSANPVVAPPGLSYPSQTHRSMYDLSIGRSSMVERQSTGGSSYTGSFNPFAPENADDAPSRRYSPIDEERKVSRFGFARGRHGSTSSPLHASSPLSNNDSASYLAHHSSSELTNHTNHAQPQWPFQTRLQHHEFAHYQSNSAMSSPLAQHVQAQPQYGQQQQQQPTRFQPFDSGVSEAQLREFIQSSRERANPVRNGPLDQTSYNPNQPFNDPAIMSARLASPILPQALHDTRFANAPAAMESFSSHHLAYGPPPGLSYQDVALLSPVVSNHQGYGTGSGPSTNLEVSQASGSAQVSTSPSLAPSPALSSSDFPALSAAAIEPVARAEQQNSEAPAPAALRIAQERAVARAAEKERIALEKAAEKERAAILKAEKEKAAKEKAEKEKVEKEKAAKEKAEREQAARERLEKERAEKQAREQAAEAKKAAAASAKAAKAATASAKPSERAGSQLSSSTAPSTPTLPDKTPIPARRPQAKQASAAIGSEPVTQVPILSKMPKKNKPVAKPIKIPKEDSVQEAASTLPSAATSDGPQFPDARATETSSNNSRAHSVDWVPASQPTSVKELLSELSVQFPWLNISKHPFFDAQKINPASKMPLEYGPLVHALSALSVGGGSFANNMPSGSIDNAVSSFQQLLETLTQTISDLLRLLPRTTWDDSASFDSVLRDMLKGDDFLDDGGDDQNGQGKEDEVAALTLALERRARWMEVQLSKLEELHRDINTAAVRAVLSFNDSGWDPHGFLPRLGNTLNRFDQIGLVSSVDVVRTMSADELEKKLGVAKEAAAFAEAELREVMQNLQVLRPSEDHEDF